MGATNTETAAAAAAQWLGQNRLKDVDSAIIEGEQQLAQLEQLKDGDPKKIGPLLGKLKGQLGMLKAMERVPWQPLTGGHICIGHRPSKKKLTALRLQGATHLLTLLSGSEGALSLQRAAGAQGLDWIWFAMESGHPPPPERDQEARALFGEMKRLLEAGACIYVHCSAGIHRTGMIANGFLRFLGHSQDEADTVLAALRQETSDGVGKHRKAWGDRFA